jgi:hypothetical protein
MPKVIDGGLSEGIGAGDVGPVQPAPAPKVQTEGKVKVVIHEQEGQEGMDDVLLGNNGDVIRIKRGYEVEIAERFFSVLQDAKYEIPVRQDDGTETVKVVPRYAYTRIS